MTSVPTSQPLSTFRLPASHHLIPGWIRGTFIVAILSLVHCLPFTQPCRWIIFTGLCLAFSLFSFSFALFVLSSIAICQGRVGFIGLTLSGVIIDDVYLAETFLPFFFFSYLFDRLKNPDRHQPIWHRHTTQFLGLYGLLVLLALVCVYLTPWQERAWYQYLHVVSGFCYFLMLSSLNERRLLQLTGFFAFWGLIYFGLAQSSILEYALDFGQVHAWKDLYLQLVFTDGKLRANVMGPPSVAAVTMGFCMWCMILFACLNKGWRRILYATLAFVCSVGVFYTRTRSEMVGILAASLVFGAIIGWPHRTMLRAWVVGIGLTLLTWLLAAAMDMAGAVKRIAISGDTSENASLGIRLDLWRMGIEDTAANLGFGKGTGSMFSYRDEWPHAHNVYFSVLFDLGFPGMVIWGLLFAGLIVWLIHALKVEPVATPHAWALACCAAFTAELATGGLLQDEYTTFIWSLFPALLLAVLNRHLLVRSTPLAYG